MVYAYLYILASSTPCEQVFLIGHHAPHYSINWLHVGSLEAIICLKIGHKITSSKIFLAANLSTSYTALCIFMSCPCDKANQLDQAHTLSLSALLLGAIPDWIPGQTEAHPKLKPTPDPIRFLCICGVRIGTLVMVQNRNILHDM